MATFRCIEFTPSHFLRLLCFSPLFAPNLKLLSIYFTASSIAQFHSHGIGFRVQRTEPQKWSTQQTSTMYGWLVYRMFLSFGCEWSAQIRWITNSKQEPTGCQNIATLQSTYGWVAGYNNKIFAQKKSTTFSLTHSRWKWNFVEFKFGEELAGYGEIVK